MSKPEQDRQQTRNTEPPAMDSGSSGDTSTGSVGAGSTTKDTSKPKKPR